MAISKVLTKNVSRVVFCTASESARGLLAKLAGMSDAMYDDVGEEVDVGFRSFRYGNSGVRSRVWEYLRQGPIKNVSDGSKVDVPKMWH